MSLNNHQLPDFDTYLEMLKSAAHHDDESRAISSNPKHCLSQHALNYDYVDHGDDMFVQSWNLPTINSHEHEIVFQTNEHEFSFQHSLDEAAHLLQHQTSFSPAKQEDKRNKTDRPHVPTELWNQLSEDVRLWYLGYNKSETATIKAQKQKSQQKSSPSVRAQQHVQTVKNDVQSNDVANNRRALVLAANEHAIE